MKTVKLRKSVKFAAAMSVALVAGSVQIASAAHINTLPAAGCTPTSLSQALGKIVGGNIAWNHMRVHNRAAAPLWVVCSALSTMDSASDTSLFTIEGGTVQVTAWFGPDAAPDAEVFCVVREVLGATSATTGESYTVTISAGSPVPDTEIGSVTTTDFNIGAPVTASCRLDPGTGIQGVHTILIPTT